MKNALIILAGGTGKRLNNPKKTPKQFIKIDNKNIIEYFLENLDNKIFDIIVIVCETKKSEKYLKKTKEKFFNHKLYFTQSGKNRQLSSKKGLFFLKKFNPKKVLIHDAARPLVNNNLIKKIIKKLDVCKVCAPFITQNDYIKYKKNNYEINNYSILNHFHSTLFCIFNM